MVEKYSIACIYHIMFIHLPANRCRDRLHAVSVISNAAMYMSVHVSVGVPAFILYDVCLHFHQNKICNIFEVF